MHGPAMASRCSWMTIVQCRHSCGPDTSCSKTQANLPAELQDRKDALQLADLLKTLDEDDPCVEPLDARLRLLEMKLRQAGMSSDFLHQHYQQQLRARFSDLDTASVRLFF